MSAVLARALADLRGNRMQNGLVFVIIVAATATLYLALTVSRGADDVWDRTFADANGPHVTFFGPAEDDLAGITALDGVTGSSGPFLTVWDHSLVYAGAKYEMVLYGLPTERPEVARPLLTEGRWLSDVADEIVLERTLALDAGIEVGDHVWVTTAAGPHELMVVGRAINTSRGTFPNWEVATAWLTPTTLAVIEPDPARTDAALFVRLAQPEESEHFSAQVVARFSALSQYGNDDWHEVRADATEWNTLVSIFLGGFSVAALAAVAFVIANAIGGRVLAQFREIGLLKAIGFTPGQVSQVFLLENLALTLAAGLFGVAAGVIVAPIFLDRTAEMLNAPSPPAFHVDLAAAALLGVLALVTLFTWLPAWRGGRIGTVQAITIGFAPAQARPSLPARLAEWLRLPVVVVAGVKDSFARPMRAVLTVFALTMTVLTLTFALSVEAMTDRLIANPALTGNAFDMRVERSELSDAETRALLVTEPEITAIHTRDWVRAQVTEDTGETISFGVRVLDGDYARFPYVVAEGRLIAKPNEAMVGIGLMQLLDVRVGDEVPVTFEGQPTMLRIVGRVLDDDDDAQLAFVDAATVRPFFPDVQPREYALLLAEGSDATALQARLLNASGFDLDVWRPDEETPEEATTIRTVMLGLSGVLLVIGLVNLLTTTLLNVHERMRDYGVLKAIGMTPREVVLSVASGVSLLALPAVVIGIPFGLWFWEVTFRAVGESEMGADPEMFTQPSWLSLALLAPSMIALAVLASTIPARRAARVEVAEFLRYE